MVVYIKCSRPFLEMGVVCVDAVLCAHCSLVLLSRYVCLREYKSLLRNNWWKGIEFQKGSWKLMKGWAWRERSNWMQRCCNIYCLVCFLRVNFLETVNYKSTSYVYNVCWLYKFAVVHSITALHLPFICGSWFGWSQFTFSVGFVLVLSNNADGFCGPSCF